jgi:hypothetical protein
MNTFVTLFKRLLSAFQNIAYCFPDLFYLDTGSLSHTSCAALDLERQNHFRIAVDYNIGIVRDNDNLPSTFCFSQLSDNQVVD